MIDKHKDIAQYLFLVVGVVTYMLFSAKTNRFSFLVTPTDFHQDHFADNLVPVKLNWKRTNKPMKSQGLI